jgi:hypothetical protein
MTALKRVAVNIGVDDISVLFLSVVLGRCRQLLETRSNFSKFLRYLVLGEPSSFAVYYAHYLLVLR